MQNGGAVAAKIGPSHGEDMRRVAADLARPVDQSPQQIAEAAVFVCRSVVQFVDTDQATVEDRNIVGLCIRRAQRGMGAERGAALVRSQERDEFVYLAARFRADGAEVKIKGPI